MLCVHVVSWFMLSVVRTVCVLLWCSGRVLLQVVHVVPAHHVYNDVHTVRCVVVVHDVLLFAVSAIKVVFIRLLERASGWCLFV